MAQRFQLLQGVSTACLSVCLSVWAALSPLFVVVPMNGTGPMRYLFRLDPESKYLHLREKLAELCGTPANQIAFMDVGGGVVRVGGSALQYLNPLMLLFRSSA